MIFTLQSTLKMEHHVACPGMPHGAALMLHHTQNTSITQNTFSMTPNVYVQTEYLGSSTTQFVHPC